MNIQEIKQIDKKNIAIMDTSSISFMQGLSAKGFRTEQVLNDYELILIPAWVLNEIKDASGRMEYILKLVDFGYPIFSIAEETYSELVGQKEYDLYRIVYASAFQLGRLKAYLRRYVEKNDPLDMEPYSDWIRKLYDQWPIPGEILSSGREKKKNAGEISITILAEIISWNYSGTDALTIYSQDSDTYESQRVAEEKLRKEFASKKPVPVSFKSNDAILCQLYREGEMSENDLRTCRKDERKLVYSKEQTDKSLVIVTEVANNEVFIELVKDESVHIVF